MRGGTFYRLWPSYMVLALSLAVCVAAFYYVEKTVSADEAHRFEMTVRSLKESLAEQTDRSTDLLLSARAHVETGKDLTRESWRRFVGSVELGRYPGAIGLGYLRPVARSDLAAYTARLRGEGFADFAVHPAGDRPVYYPVDLTEPRTERNRAGFGFDLYSEATRRAAMMAARDTGDPRASGKVLLLSSAGQERGPAGFLEFVPVYRDTGGAGESSGLLRGAAERRAALAGFVYAPFRVDALMAGLLREVRDAGVVDFQVYDGQEPAETSLLFDSRDAGAESGAADPSTASASGGRGRAPLTESPGAYRSIVRVAGRPWTLVAVPSPALLHTVDHHLPWLVLTGGGLVSWLLFGISWMQMRSRVAGEAAAAQVAESERRLRASELRYRLKIEQSPVAVQTLSPDGRSLYVNQAWEALWGVTLADLGDYNMLEDEELSRKGVMPLIRKAFDGEAVTIGPVFYDAGELPSGARRRSRWVRSVLYPVKDPGTGEVTELVLMHEDFTLKKEAEAELREAKEAAEAANRAKDQFLAVLSHELRNPLSPVLAMVDLLSGGQVEAGEASEAMEVIRRNVELEARLIDDLLDVTRISRGKLHLDMGVVDVHQSLEHAMQICAAEAGGKHVRMERYLDATSHVVRGDAARLQQVFWNLIKNAVKFTPPEGSIYIRTMDGAGGRLVIEVSDTGIGVAPEKLPRIFEAFEQADGSITRRFGGLGLGLTISKALVAAHGGEITAKSPGVGQGTTFRVCLETTSVTAPAEGKAEAPRNGEEGSRGRGKVLLIEDQPDARRGMQMLLEREGYEVRAASTAAEALEMARDWPFDLLVSDIGLPDLSGLELLPQLRAMRAAPAIALTGFGMEQDVQRAAAAGFDVHITKPVSFERLRESIGRLMKKC